MPTPKPQKVARFDAVPLTRKARRDRWGNYHVPAIFVTPGVYEYRRADGSISRELKSPEEVYKPAFLESLRSATLTDGHPPVAVTPDNAKEYDCGHVKDELTRVDEGLLGEIVVKDKSLIAKMDSRKVTQVSIGLDCDVDETPGTWQSPTGSLHPYDRAQIDMAANHAAGVTTARIPTANLRLDSAEMIVPTTERNTMSEPKLTRIDVGDSEPAFASELDAHRINTHITYLKTKGTEVFNTSSKHEARADAAEATITELRAELKTHTDLDIDALVRERSDTLASAARLMKADALDPLVKAGKSNEDIRRAACEAREVKTDGKDDVYVTARFDALLETASAAPKNDQAASIANLVNAPAPTQKQSTRQRYDEQTKALSSAWKVTS